MIVNIISVSMSRQLERFEWQVARDGYQWVTSRAAFPPPRDRANEPLSALIAPDLRHQRESRFLIPQSSVGKSYSPLVTAPTLFREFALLEPTEIGFLRFANKYGSLGVGVSTWGAKTDVVAVDAEPFYLWQQEWHRISEVNGVLRALQTQDHRSLSKWFVINGDRAEYRQHPKAPREIVASKYDVRSKEMWDHATSARNSANRTRRVARAWVQSAVNERLSGRPERAAVTHARITVEGSGQLMFNLTPASLLGCLWLQCARVLVVDPRFAQCAYASCQRWFEVSPDGRRRNTKYCEPRCRLRAHRAKPEEQIKRRTPRKKS